MTSHLPGCTLPDGTRVPRLGAGTWHMGEDASRRSAEVAALRHALYLGITLVHQAVDALGELVSTGRIHRWGVSNFDVADLEELIAVPGRESVAVNPVLYNLVQRGIEFD